MNEIEKLYENAGIKLDRCKYAKYDYEGEEGTWYYCIKENKECWTYPNGDADCVEKGYPPFTAKKQLEIIKLISKQGRVIIENWETDSRGFNVVFRANSNLRYITFDSITRQTLEEALAQIVNELWQDLIEDEKQQIKEILE